MTSSPDSTITLAPAASPWPSVVAIALGAFALVVSEFLPVGMLAQISSDLTVNEGTVGLLVTATAAMAAAAAPVAAIALGSIDRRLVIAGLTGLAVLSNVISMLAVDYAMLVLARIVLGIGLGGFWAVSLTVAARLVDEQRVATASSIVLGGISVATVVSTPMASFIAIHGQWRTAFAVSAVLSVVVLIVQSLVLPPVQVERSVTIRTFTGVLASPSLRAIMLTVVLVVGGQFAAYTFIGPYLHDQAHFATGTVSPLLLLYGIVSVIGNFTGGWLISRTVRRAVLTTVTLFALALVILATLTLHSSQALVLTGLVLWSLAWGMTPVVVQVWMISSAPNSPEAAQTMYTFAFQAAISAGSVLGAVAVNAVGLQPAIWLAAGLLIFAVLTVAMAPGKSGPRVR